MPTLADIYSAIDSAKRKGADFVRNPGASLQQMIGYGVDRANAARDQLYQATAEEGISYGPKTQKLAKQMAETYNPIGMTVWHGSPYKFTKFDASKIGTGEGNQAYGHGIYVAENPKVAEGYKETLKHKQFSKIVQKGRNEYDVVTPDGQVLAKSVYLGQAHKAKNAFDTNVGSVYKIDLPDENIEKMLDWNKPLSQQHPDVQAAFNLSKYAPDSPIHKMTGMEAYVNYGKRFGNPTSSAPETAKAFRELGIPGIKYLDEGSRDANAGTRNFVIFPGNEHLLKIQDINSQPIN